MPLKISAVGLSDVGLVRQNNEDVWDQLLDEGFFVLADGMGGHQAGEVASREAAKGLCRLMKKVLKGDTKRKKSLEEIKDHLFHAIEQVNEAIFKMGNDSEALHGMGTTLCCLCIQNEGLVYGHVGDSRIYRLRNKHLKALTKDHSLLRELVDMGQITEKQAADFLYKNIITKAIGTEPVIEPTVTIGDIHQGDLYLLCSDGLTDLLSKDEIESILISSSNIDENAHQLINSAKEKGGHDNITVVLVKVLKSHAQQDLS